MLHLMHPLYLSLKLPLVLSVSEAEQQNQLILVAEDNPVNQTVLRPNN
jgi:hypothetical protein